MKHMTQPFEGSDEYGDYLQTVGKSSHTKRAYDSGDMTRCGMQKGTFARWLYRGHSPNWIARVMNKRWALVGAASFTPNLRVTLEGVGRKSGRIVSLPMIIVAVDEYRYLLSMLGANVQWVRNVRAAGGRAVLRSGRHSEVQLREVPAKRRAPILKAYLRRAPGARPHIPVDKNAQLAELATIAWAYPVLGAVAVKFATVATTGHRSPIPFFVLTFGLAVPFLLLGAATGLELLPGLPIAALMTVCPALAAAILLCREQREHRENGLVGVRALLRRSFDFKRIEEPIWYIPTLLLMPAMALLSFYALRLMGTPIPDPQAGLLQTALLSLVFFVGALGEELGWSGYALDPMQAHWGALGGSLLLGAIWALYHYIALAQANRPLAWIAWWTMGTMATRLIMVWLYNNTGGSVFAAALFHMTINLTWQLFPVNGSYFDPRTSGIILALVALVITVHCEPRTLTRRRASIYRLA